MSEIKKFNELFDWWFRDKERKKIGFEPPTPYSPEKRPERTKYEYENDKEKVEKNPEPKEMPNVPIEQLPIKVGDTVEPKNLDGLGWKSSNYLRGEKFFEVTDITDSKGNPYKNEGVPHIQIGYTIPFKMFRFVKYEKPFIPKDKQKVLFLQFDLEINLHDEIDNSNFFRGYKTLKPVFVDYFKEKDPDIHVEFRNYDDIYRIKNDFYLDEIKLKDFDFIFFGFMTKFTTICRMLINYLDKNNVPYLKYGTYQEYDSKAYEMDLVQSLGYPYIPSILTTKLTKDVIENVKEFGFPVIVKDIYLNRGEGVKKVDNMTELKTQFNWGGMKLIQKFIPNDGDHRVIVIKNKTALVIKRLSQGKDFRSNIAAGGKAVRSTLPDPQVKMCEDISKHLFCDFIGFDVLQDLNTKEYYIMETNSAPHFPTFSVISGINVPALLTNYIIKEIKKKKHQLKLKFDDF